jgi:hypothetical protein
VMKNLKKRASSREDRFQKSLFVGGSWSFVVISSVAAARIYREDMPIVTVIPHVSKPHDYVNHMFKRP